MAEHIKKTFNSVYKKFFLLNDSPQRIAMSFGLGVFLGILPFTGVLAAIAVAWFFRLNKAAAILGSVLTNTWLGFIVLGVAVHLSCVFLGINGYDIQLKFTQLIKDFHWSNLADASILKIVAAVTLGYLILSVILSLLAYVICLAIIHRQRRVQ